MKKTFSEYGGIIVVVIAVVAMIGLVSFLMKPSGILDSAFGNLAQSFVDKTDELVSEAGLDTNGGMAVLEMVVVRVTPRLIPLG